VTAAELALLAKGVAPVVGLAVGVVIGFAMLRARRLRAERAARDAAQREATVRRHSSGVVLDEGVGIVLREPRRRSGARD
jgi:hypothetical protein